MEAAFVATDKDSDAITYSLTGEHAKYFVISSEGKLSFNTASGSDTASDYEKGTGVEEGTIGNQRKLYSIVVVATDSKGGKDEKAVKVQVRNLDESTVGTDEDDDRSGGFDLSAKTVGVYVDGGKGNDRITGGNKGDLLKGGAGDDTLEGGTGNDYLVGGEGRDRLYGGEGRDGLDGGEGDDTLEGGTGNDYLVGGEGDDILVGGEGNDRLLGGEGRDRLYGGEGKNWLYGEEGDDFLYGGAGNDTLYGGGGNDFLYGGADDDTYFFDLNDIGDNTLSDASGNDRIRLYLGAKVVTATDVKLALVNGDLKITYGENWLLTIKDWTTNASVESLILGTSSFARDTDTSYKLDNYNSSTDTTASNLASLRQEGNELADDVLNGTAYDDYFFGLTGDDTLKGEAGNDYLNGGEGKDTLQGDTGDDRVYGWTGDDTLYGGEGNDELQGGTGDDKLDGGEGNDNLSGDAGNDSIFGGEGEDTLNGGAGDDILNGEDGRDTLQGGDGRDTLQGGDGNDTLYGGKDNDTLYGGIGNDTLEGGDGNDALYGGIDNDTLEGGDGNDALYGGIGNDTLDGGWDNDTYIFNLAETGDNTISERSGNDRIRLYLDGITATSVNLALVESDLKITYTPKPSWSLTINNWTTNASVESLILGTSSFAGSTDTSYNLEEGNFTTTEKPASDTNTLTSLRQEGDELNDTLTGTAYDDYLLGLGGNDTLKGEAGNDDLFGGAGDDTLYGGADRDYLRGEEGNDSLYGEKGNDYLSGWTGNDFLYGGEGNDTLDGGAGNDILRGEKGDDNLRGDLGKDTYIFNIKETGHNTIFDRNGTDTIRLHLTDGVTATDVKLILDGNDLKITYGTSTTWSLTIKDWSTAGGYKVETLSLGKSATVSSDDTFYKLTSFSDTKNTADTLTEITTPSYEDEDSGLLGLSQFDTADF